MGVVAPFTHAKPEGQAMDDDCPVSGWYRPAAHRLQTALRAAAMLPSSHAVGTALPVAHALPLGQSTHSAALVRLVALP